MNQVQKSGTDPVGAMSPMIVVSVIVLSLILWMLYQSKFEQRVESLQAMVLGQVSLIEAVARF